MALGWRKDYLRYRSYYLNILNLYKKREDLRMFLEIILSLSAISFFSVFALKPTLLTISTLLKEINTKKEMIIKMDTKIRNLQTAQNILNQESLRIPVLELSIPHFPQPQNFVHQIEGIASSAEVEVLGIRVDETSLKGNVPVKDQEMMGFSVSATGSFQSLFSFLKNLENLRSPVKIDVLGISLAKKEQGNILTLVVTGKVPYLGGIK